MLKSIRLQNFFSFQDETIEFNTDVNVLLGINGSGKSNLLKAFRLLKEGVSGVGLRNLINDQWGGFDSICNSSVDIQGKNIELEFTFDGSKILHENFALQTDLIYLIRINKTAATNYSIDERLKWADFPQGLFLLDFKGGIGVLNGRVLDSDGFSRKQEFVKYTDQDAQELALAKIFDSDRYWAQSVFRSCISEIVVYDFFDTRPDSKIRRPVANSALNYLSSDGTNLTHILQLLQREKQSVYRSIMDGLKDVNAHFNNISYRQIGSNIELYLAENHLERAVPLAHISDGTLRYLCLLTIIYNPNRGKFICIDEPEISLHPDMIHGIASGIEKASPQTCFLITSHNQALVNHFDISQVMTIEKDENNFSSVQHFPADFLKVNSENKLSGDLWRDGHLGGNRW